MFRVDGLKALDRALSELPKANAKPVVTRTLKKAAQPIADDYRAGVRIDRGDLKASIGVGTKLTRRQAKLNRKESDVEVYAGAGGLVQAITEEFGTVKEAPNPALRPAWDAGKMGALEDIKTGLWTEIEKTAKRVAKRRAGG